MSTLITVGRQFGAGGKGVALVLGERLGIPVYDNELLSKAAEESGFGRDIFARKDEKKGLLSLSNAVSGFQHIWSTRGYLDDSSIFKMQCDVIRDIAARGSAVFVGRASDYVLRDMKRLSVFLSAPLELRAKTVSERSGISLAEAMAMVPKRDRQRESYYNYLTLGHWGVASGYDLCLDSSILGIEGTADFIIDFGRRSGLIDL